MTNPIEIMEPHESTISKLNLLNEIITDPNSDPRIIKWAKKQNQKTGGKIVGENNTKTKTKDGIVI